MNLYTFAKAALLPGTLGFLFIGLATGLACLRWPRTNGLARRWLWLLVLGYVAMSMPGGACGLESMVSAGYAPVNDPRQLEGLGGVIVLDGGTARLGRDGLASAVPVRVSVERGLEAARVYRMMAAPLVVVTGGAYERVTGIPEGASLANLLVELGVPRDRIMLDDQSRSTAESARNVPRLLRQQGIERWALVTSAVHMRRSVRAFGAEAGVAAPAPVSCGARNWWLPQPGSLERSYQALYEAVGLPYYIVRGWID